MSDGPERSSSSRPVLPNLLVGAILVVTVAAALVAFLTIDPEPRAPRHARTSTVFSAPASGVSAQSSLAPAFADDLALPPAESAPGLTSADVAKSAANDEKPPADWRTLPIDKLRARAGTNEGPAMEELARRLMSGTDIAPDPPAAAGWMMRAAELGSASAQFSVGVMYERGFVVERDSTRAAAWYRRAAASGLAVAKHNLALLLRDGKGVPRDGVEALKLLRSAARQGMAASMFMLGDIYEQGDAAPRDLAAALAWFSITEEYERQVNHGGESTLEKTAAQRVQSLKRTLTPAELQRAEEVGQSEFHQIVLALSPPKPPAQAAAPQPPQASAAPAETAPQQPTSAPGEDAAGWPKDPAGQVRAIQQLLVELKLLRDKPDGMLGPMTRNALRDFQRSTGLAPSGEPSREVYAALLAKRVSQATAKGWSLPPPQSAAKANEMPATTPIADLAKSERAPTAIPATPDRAEAPVAASAIDIAPAETPAPPTSADIAAAMPASTPAAATPPADPELHPAASPPTARVAKQIDPPPRPPLRVDETKPLVMTAPAAPERPHAASSEPTKAASSKEVWPNSPVEQTKAIQLLLRELRFFHGTPNGRIDAPTRTAIRDYQRLAGLKETGETSKALFDSLKEMRAMMAPKRD